MGKDDGSEMGLEDLLQEVGQQLVVLGVVLGCSLKVNANKNPDSAKKIEREIRKLIERIGYEKMHPQANALLEIMYNALEEGANGE